MRFVFEFDILLYFQLKKRTYYTEVKSSVAINDASTLSKRYQLECRLYSIDKLNVIITDTRGY